MCSAHQHQMAKTPPMCLTLLILLSSHDLKTPTTMLDLQIHISHSLKIHSASRVFLYFGFFFIAELGQKCMLLPLLGACRPPFQNLISRQQQQHGALRRALVDQTERSTFVDVKSARLASTALEKVGSQKSNGLG